MTKTEQQLDALNRAVNGTSLTNYAAIMHGMMSKGIAEVDIVPRENVFTYGAWQAKGRQVKLKEHGVKICTYRRGEKLNKETGKIERFTYPGKGFVFHVSQTDAKVAGK